MPLGRPRRRRRSGNAGTVFFLVLLGMVAIAAGLWHGYRVLSQDLRDRIVALEDRAAEQREALDRAERVRGSLSVELEEARSQMRYLRTRYDREVPEGVGRRLYEQVQRMLDDGVEPERLSFLIEAAATPPACADAPETRQFPVALADRSGGGGSAVTFAERRITLTAEGEVATDEAGRPEAWFDPVAPVRARFARLGGETETVRGMLPLHHAMIVDGAEYRFTITAGQRGFAEATAMRCDLP